jgi:CheY-like chemotaxis protein
MTRLVDDLLDLARITQGKVRLQLARVDLNSVVSQAVESNSSLMLARGHALELSLPSPPLFVHGDAVRLSQVVANLHNNAAKYTEPGGRIALSVVQEGERAVLTVRDNGIGIEPAMLSRIFDLFIQARGAGNQTGLGIGLTLVKRLVELHGGTVEARSAGTRLGSEFAIRLPVLLASASQEAAAAVHSVVTLEAGLRILVVDDNPDVAKGLARLLALAGHDTRAAYDGPAALEAAAAFAPQVALLDLGMPRMDGLEVARRLRNGALGERMLLVAVTGFGRQSDRERSTAAGFDHHLIKPIDVAALRALVAEHAARMRRDAREARPAASAVSTVQNT